jgi:hypothetical protein
VRVLFDDGQALFEAVVSYGPEGIVVKRGDSVYRSGQRSGTKIRNPRDVPAARPSAEVRIPYGPFPPLQQ